DRAEGRIFRGVVAEDVWDDYGRLAVPAIPRGSPVELIVRIAPDGDLVLDVESVLAHGQRYSMRAAPERVEAPRGTPNNEAEFAGGGAVLGAIIGAIVGGGKGAAIGAAGGAAAGLGVALIGRSVRVPSGTLLTFRLERPLMIGTPDDGYERDG